MSEIRLDSIGQAQAELDNPSVDLDARQVVCGSCRLVYWGPLGRCPEC